MSATLAVLIIGGYGRFGGRIVELLEHEGRLRIFVAGRSASKAQAFCRARDNVAAILVPTAFDRDGDLRAQLAALKPDVVIDASGPFQDYGEKAYAVVEACIAQGVHYLDLADGRKFVSGIAALDAAAQKAGLFVLSGVSSFPVLTAAAARELSAGMANIRSIRAGIAPSPYAGVGENVIRAIAGYAGQTIALEDGNRVRTAHPFTEQIRYTVSPPGAIPLNRTLFSLVDVPDLVVLKKIWPEAETVWVGAGPVPEILHRALIGFAWLVRNGLVRSLLPLTPLMHAATNRLRWGEHRGGLFVEVTGKGSGGETVTRSWHMIAEGDDGPLIPSMPAAIIIEKMLEGDAPAIGARASTSDLELADYETQFSRRAIITGTRETPEASEPLYRRILGSAWESLPEAIRDIHSLNGECRFAGRASVARGSNLISRLLAKIIGFPDAGEDVPIAVTFTATPEREIWTRDFAGRSFFSEQFEGTSNWQHLLCERFGYLTFAIALVSDGQRLSLVLRRWRAFGIPMPMWLCPRSDAFETEEDGRFRFHVEISGPLIGLIVRYRGWLAPEAVPDATHAAANMLKVCR